MARLGLEHFALGLAGKRGAERIFERFVARPELIEDQLAVGAIGRPAMERVALIVEHGLGPVGQSDGRARNVRRDHLHADIARSGERRLARGQDRLAFGR